MRWITFLILLYLAYALQISHLGAWPHGAHGDDPWPAIEYLPLLAVFYALFAADAAAPLAALFCGLAYDVGNHDFLGTNLIPIALTTLLLLRIRLSIFREHLVSHILMTLLALLSFAFLSALFRWLLHAPLYGNSVWSHFTCLAASALYTALVAPAAFRLLFRLRRLLGFTPQRYRSLY